MLANRVSGTRKSIGLQLGGTREAAKILSGARKITEQRVMPKLAKIDREVAKAIEEAMFVFDNLLELDDKNLSTLIRSIDSDVLVKSLKGVEEDVRNRFLGCMSSRAADGIRDEMEARGPMKLADVLDAQKVMIAIARGLVKDGTLDAGQGRRRRLCLSSPRASPAAIRAAAHVLQRAFGDPVGFAAAEVGSIGRRGFEPSPRRRRVISRPPIRA
jgi:flagellar motor switch protein FliG